jgi:hypothetical protein
LFERASHCDARVVNEHVNAAMLGRDELREFSHRDPVSHIEAMSRHTNAVTSNQIRRGGHSFFVYVRECEMTTATRQRHGDRAPDAARGTRDDSRSPLETHALSHWQPPSLYPAPS